MGERMLANVFSSIQADMCRVAFSFALQNGENQWSNVCSNFLMVGFCFHFLFFERKLIRLAYFLAMVIIHGHHSLWSSFHGRLRFFHDRSGTAAVVVILKMTTMVIIRFLCMVVLLA